MLGKVRTSLESGSEVRFEVLREGASALKRRLEGQSLPGVEGDRNEAQTLPTENQGELT